MKPKILIIADSDPRKQVLGGVGIYSYNLVKYLSKKKFDVIFIGKKQEGGVIHKFSSLKFIELNHKSNQSNYIFLNNLFRLASKHKVDENTIIHAQRPDWLVPFRNFSNKKIAVLHGSHSKNVFVKKGFLIGKLYSMLEKKGLEIADAIVSVSEECSNYYKGLYGKYPGITEKILTIPLGIDLQNFRNLDKDKSRKKYGFKKSDKVVVYVGRFEKEKNLKLMINACQKARLKLFLVGTGREENELKEYAKRIKADVTLHGAVSNEKVPEMLSCGNVFALTSIHEGLPTAVIEAMAAGLPVVSTNVGDVSKLVVDGKTGYIVDEDNIVQKLGILMKNPYRYKNDCLNKSREYSWDKIGDKIKDIYDMLLNVSVDR